MSLIKELQDDAVNLQDPLALLRKALTVSKKLGSKKFTEWIHREQNGYKDRVPQYRLLKGDIVMRYSVEEPWFCFSKYNDQPLQTYECTEKLSTLVSKHEDCFDGFVYFPLIPILNRYIVNQYPLAECLLRVERNQLFSLIDKVKNVVAEWSSVLDRQGIEGKENQFTPNEKDTAKEIIYNFYGNITIGEEKMINVNKFKGNAQGAQIQVGTKDSTQTQTITVSARCDFETAHKVIEEILKYQPMFESEFGEKTQEIVDAINEAKKAIEEKDEGKLKNAWKWIKSVAANAAGGMLAAGIPTLLAKVPIL